MIIRVSPAEPALFERAVHRFRATTAGAAAFTRAPGTIAFVAADNEAVHGWCWGYHLARPDGAAMLYLHHLEVAEDSRRRGIGRGLLDAFMAAGRQLGASKMFLTTGEANTPARHLYESMGAGPATHGPTVNYWFQLRPPDPE